MAEPVLRHALFDMDGLLLDTERLCMLAFDAATRDLGLPPMRETFYRCIGHRRESSDRIVAEALPEDVSLSAFTVAWNTAMAAELQNPVPLRPGVAEALGALTGAGVAMSVATSTRTAKARHHLEAVGLLSHFTDVIGGDQVERGKPEPDIYHKAAATLGVTAEACAAFEDSDTGTRAAVASGARVVQIPDLRQPSDEVRALGHMIRPTLAEAVVAAGLLDVAPAIRAAE